MLLVAALILQLTQENHNWYGPEKLAFELKHAGNPFDPNVNDVRVRFRSKEKAFERTAYYSHGEWHVNALSEFPGIFAVKVTLNGRNFPTKISNVNFKNRLVDGLIRTDGTKFVTAEGRPFWPIGHNLAWQNKGDTSMLSQLKTMHENGINWTRIWATSWDDRNPFLLESKPNPPKGRIERDGL